MLGGKKALLLLGSPKVKNSTSESLGIFLLEGLNKRGYTVDKIQANSALKRDSKELLEKVNDTDILIISFPLYVDCLPAPLIRVLELVNKDRKERELTKEQKLIAIANNGFPEALHSFTSLKIIENFAIKSKFKWLGGFAFGAGGAISGRHIEQLGGMTRSKVTALNMIVDALTNDNSIPKEAFDLMTSDMMPTWLYTFFGNHGWKTQAKKYKTKQKLYEKPYA